MFKDKFNNIKSLIKSKPKDNKKKIENLIVFIVLLVITVIAINVILGDDSKSKHQKNDSLNSSYKQLANETQNSSSNISDNSEYNLEEKLEDILSKVSGIGQVKVLITYSETSETVPMYNEKTTESTTQETDTNGGVRTIQQSDSSKEVVYEEETNGKVPITKKVILPKVEGAIVIAEGANNTNIKVNIIDAVSAVTGLPTHKIQVFEMK